ncbi:MAG: redoxin domain-containing protein [Terriglobia bacterium]
MNELGEFVKRYEELRALDVQVLGVSVDPPEINRGVQQNLRAPFPILSDARHEAMEAYGTRDTTITRKEGTINRSTLVLIDKTGTIRWIRAADDYRVRAPIEQVLSEARKLK